jgi:hypothetical protein
MATSRFRRGGGFATGAVTALLLALLVGAPGALAGGGTPSAAWPSLAPIRAAVGPAVSAQLYPVTFEAQALAQGSAWSLTVGGRTYAETNLSPVVDLANGTYLYSAYTDGSLADGGPAAPYDNGSFVVAGLPVEVTLWATAPAVAPVSSGASPVLPGAALSIVLPAALVLFLVGVTVGARAVRRHRTVALAALPIRGPKVEAPGAPAPVPPGEEPSDPLRHML